MRVALDTNFLVYAEGLNDTLKRDIALDFVRRLSPAETIIPVQVLGELFNVLTRKGGKSREEARKILLTWQDTFLSLQTTSEALTAATDLATTHKLSIWDALILSVAAQAGCRLLLSEDFQDGFTWGGVTVTNPFSSKHHLLCLSLPSG